MGNLYEEKAEEVIAGCQSRYSLSSYSRRQLQRDHIRLEESYTETFKNNFICRILLHYMCFAQENFLDKFEKDMSDHLEKKGSNATSENSQNTKNDRISFTKELAEKMNDFEFTKNSKFKKSSVITYILEKFTYLQHSEREKIYCYPLYKTILDAIEKGKTLIIKNTKEYEVKPVRIEIDENSFSYYLIGYSKERGNNEKDSKFECYPFKLSRIRKCRPNGKEYMLSANEIGFANKRIEQYGCAYINAHLTGTENTVVRLTEKGYTELFLKIVSHQRPIPISEPNPVYINEKTFFDLVFNCSYAQIRNYFFSFGGEAEIVSPEHLRKQFIYNYEEALKRYPKAENQNI